MRSALLPFEAILNSVAEPFFEGLDYLSRSIGGIVVDYGD
jgi:hypothetical protein